MASGGTSTVAAGGSDLFTAGGSAGAAMTGGSTSSGGATSASGASTCTPDVVSSRPKTSSLLDDFSDGSAGPAFFVNGEPANCALESSGHMVVSLPNPTPASNYCYYESADRYDFTCDSLVVKVPQIARATLGLQTFVYLILDASRTFYLVVDNGAYILGSLGGKTVSGGRYDSTAAWWRLREEGVTGTRQVVFETSGDARTWRERARIARPFALNDVKIALGVGSYQTTTDPGSGVFACLNTPAGCR